MTNGVLISYTVYYAIDNVDSTFGPEESVIVLATQEPLSVVLSSLVEFTLYRVAVSANTSVGEGDRSLEDTVTTDPDSASPPRNVQVMVINSTAIEVSFDYPFMPRGEIFGYLIEYGVSETDLANSDITVFNFTLNQLDNMDNQSILVTNLAPFRFYVFRVLAYSFSDTPFQTHLGEPSPNTNAVRTLEDRKLNTYVCTWLI